MFLHPWRSQTVNDLYDKSTSFTRRFDLHRRRRKKMMKSYSGHKKEKNFFFFLRFCMWPSVISQTTVTLFEQRVWTGSKQKQNTGFKRGTSVGSEQGWFVLALYNLSNFSLMLTVPILFVRHFKKTCKNV